MEVKDPDKIYENHKKLNDNLSYLKTTLNQKGLSEGMTSALKVCRFL